jgi:hypothetical protein
MVILAIKFVVFGINRLYLMRKKFDSDILFSLNIIEKKKYFIKICLFGWIFFFRYFLEVLGLLGDLEKILRYLLFFFLLCR